MGCVSSKRGFSETPPIERPGSVRDNAASRKWRFGSARNYSGRGIQVGVEELDKQGRIKSGRRKRTHKKCVSELDGLVNGLSELAELGESGSGYKGDSMSFRIGNLRNQLEGEQVAAGWPAWLSASAGEAIAGWSPLRSDAFEKLEKIGQGTYSNVFRAREIKTGRIVALKKVRFDSFEPESVRFMAREILILRRLDHPNVIKLEGLITSQLSSSIYLVFEYMEHDLTGLVSCPYINFSQSQIKCYMKQLLSGLEHCHSRGIMHRDIKGSNLLVNNDGILKVADFGLANFSIAENMQPLTSRVVTLWYRPPELLLGSTAYGETIDLWSAGCVFAELQCGRPILPGRTEVEQIHKIFKLCGSPNEDYWVKSKLPHATMFKPQQHYDSCLWDTFKDLPKTAVNLIDNLLSLEPEKRGSASSALASEYFQTEPYACDPSSFPIYPPNKEIDAKIRNEAKRKANIGKVYGAETRNATRKPYGITKLAPLEASLSGVAGQNKESRLNFSGDDMHSLKEGDVRVLKKLSINKSNEVSHKYNNISFSGPLQVSASSGFAWAKRRNDNELIRSHRSISRDVVCNAVEPSCFELYVTNNFDSKRNDSENSICADLTDSKTCESRDIAKRAMLKQSRQLQRPESFDANHEYGSQELSALYQRKKLTTEMDNTLYQDEGDKIEFSGPLLSEAHKFDKVLEKHEQQMRQLVRKSWFREDKKEGR